MSRRLLGPLVVLLGVLVAAPSAPAQVVVVSAKSAGAILDDFSYLVRAVAPEDQAQTVLDALDRFKDPATTPGLDRARPLGMYLDLPAQPGQQPSIVAFVPVTDGAMFLQTLQAQGFTIDDQPAAPGFTHQITPPGQGSPPVFGLVTTDHVYFTNDAGSAPTLKALKPATLLPKRTDAGLLSLEVRLDRLPAPYKDMALQQMAQSAEKEKVQREGENDTTYQGRLAGMQLAQDAMTALIHDSKGLTLDLGLDHIRGLMTLDLGMVAAPGTPTAGSFRTFGARKSLFRALGRDAALGAWASLPLSEPIRAAFVKGVAEARKSAQEKADDDDAKKFADKLFDALEPTIQAKDVDLGMAIRGPFPKPGQAPLYVVAFGLKLKDGKKIETIFRDAVANADPEDRADIALDLEKAADGVTSIHRIRIDDDDDDDDDDKNDKAKDKDDDDKAKDMPKDKDDDDKAKDKDDDDKAKDKDDDDKAKDMPKDDAEDKDKKEKAEARRAKQFGEPFVYFAIRDDVAIAAVGENGLEVVKQALDATGRPMTEQPAQIESVVSVAKLAALGDDGDSTIFSDMAAQVFQGPNAKKDSVRFTLQGQGDSIRLRWSIDVAVYKFLVQAGLRQQQAKAAAAAAPAEPAAPADR